MSRFNRWSSKKFEDDPSTEVERGDVVPAVSSEWCGVALTVVGGTESGRLEMLGPNGGVLGRGDGVDVAFVDYGVSRAHVRISRTPDGFVIKDLDSHNGTWIDDIRLQGTGQLAPTAASGWARPPCCSSQPWTRWAWPRSTNCAPRCCWIR